jgi:hypothetical protein
MKHALTVIALCSFVFNVSASAFLVTPMQPATMLYWPELDTENLEKEPLPEPQYDCPMMPDCENVNKK